MKKFFSVFFCVVTSFCFARTPTELVKTHTSQKPFDGFAWKCTTDAYDVYVDFSTGNETIYVIVDDTVIESSNITHTDYFSCSFFEYYITFVKNNDSTFSLTCKLLPEGTGKALLYSIPVNELPDIISQ